MITAQTVIALCVIAFLIGRGVQNWSNNSGEAIQMAYRTGYEDSRTGKESQL